MIVIYQGKRKMIAKPGVTIGISDEANRILQEHQIKQALEKNNIAEYQFLTNNEEDAPSIDIDVDDLEEVEENE